MVYTDFAVNSLTEFTLNIIIDCTISDNIILNLTIPSAHEIDADY